MIINGGSRSNGTFFAKHLANGEHNERVTICELRNLAATTIAGALREMQAVSLGTQCKNFFYHANINPREDESLTQCQWQIAVDTLERHLALNGHARLVVEHEKHQRTHRHVIWSRIDVYRMRAVVMQDDYAKHQAAARELERAFGLSTVQSVLGDARASGPRPPRRAKAWESFRARESGIDPQAMKETLTRLFHESHDGAAFAARACEHGYQLVTGNRAAFCILDEAGHLHSLARRLEGVTHAELRRFLQGVVVRPFTRSEPSDDDGGHRG